MLVALDPSLALVAPLLPPALVGPGALRALVAVASELPEVASGAALECRLGSSERVDLVMAVSGQAGGHRALLRRRDELVSPAWRRVLDFCAEWTRPGSLLDVEVPVVWLEFDVDGASSAPPPLVFPCVDRHMFGARPPGETDEDHRAACMPVITRALPLLLGSELDPAVDAALARCVALLPQRARVNYLGPLASRGREAIRLGASLPSGAISGYLDRIGWPGPARQAEEAASMLAPYASRISVQLDVGAGVLPILGLEIECTPGDRIFAPLLDALSARGLCTPAKREALPLWPKEAQVALPNHRWPSRIDGWLSLKLVVRPHEPPEAKVYLGFAPSLPLFG